MACILLQFELLVDLLGFTNRVRKKVILHETAATIKSLKRECSYLRRDRDLLQQELANLASHLDSQVVPVSISIPAGDAGDYSSSIGSNTDFSAQDYRYKHMQDYGQPEFRQYSHIC
ncbi:unnamed protein product [Phytophthora fragariaefolia]|uniref:Unnamed protein product n=1 Tax=Phytophthora fragariaefolia TaxID=1490495 RepID=A0A9W7CTB1_9STRA|nr:unnamed protein product [Phytophthora fragariaefolia]